MSTFAITKVYTSKNGSPYTPAIGENYTLTAEFDVTGTPKNPYTVGFAMADRYIPVLQTDLTAGHKVCHADFFLALDGEIPWTIDVDEFDLADAADPTKSWIPYNFPDPFGNGGNQLVLKRQTTRRSHSALQRLKGSFTPQAPASSIDFYSPRWFVATQGSFTAFSAGKIDRLTCMMGVPTTESWQKVLLSTCEVEWGGGNDRLQPKPVDGPTMYPVYLFDRKKLPNANFSMVHQSVLELRNQRVDAAKLRTVTWADLDASQAINIFKAYTSPEKVIESNDKKIGDFAQQTLGTNYRAHFTPYDAARKLYQAVIARTAYYWASDRPDTSVKVLDAGKGDCGGFSLLLVALYRNIGFPARIACGAWKGQDQGHCWCEMWFPQHGWMVSDGSSGRSACYDGSFAYFFGSVPDLNARYALIRGNTFTVGDISTSWPDASAHVSGTASPTTDAHVAVVEIEESAAMSLVEGATSYATYAMMAVHPRPPDAGSIAFNHCLCAKHGGFSAVNRQHIRPSARSARSSG